LGPQSGNFSWQDTVDPIGEFLAKQQSAGIQINPDSINHPLAKQMLTQLGIRYRFGGKSPSTGFDCSGLVGYSAQESLGLKLPPRSDEMAQIGLNVERDQLQVGDLVFFNTMGRRYSHVGVYLGDSKFVHSPAAGGVVRVEDMNQRYWDKRFTGARRLEGIELASTSATVSDAPPVTASSNLTSVTRQKKAIARPNPAATSKSSKANAGEGSKSKQGMTAATATAKKSTAKPQSTASASGSSKSMPKNDTAAQKKAPPAATQEKTTGKPKTSKVQD